LLCYENFECIGVGTCALFLRSPDRLLPRRLLQYQCRRSRHPCYLRKAHPRIFTIFSGTRQRSDHSQTGVPVYWAAPGRPLVPVRITLERSFRCRSGTRRRTGKLPRQGLGLRQSGALASPRALAATAAHPPPLLPYSACSDGGTFSCGLIKGGRHMRSPFHCWPHQHRPAESIKHVPVPQQRGSSVIPTLLLFMS
jgi:hypothetical protein